jgi:hypothetical protein
METQYMVILFGSIGGVSSAEIFAVMLLVLLMARELKKIQKLYAL